MPHASLTGLTPATHTPFHPDGTLNLAVVEQQAEHLLANQIGSVFIGGSTGESHSLTLSERLALAQRWTEVVRGTKLRVVVHVGSNCLSDARTLAAQAQQLGAAAISALAPSYFKPRSLDLLVACIAEIAAAAPETPFYFYDIPSMTGVNFSMPEFLALAKDRIPTLAGLKFTNPDLMAYQLCLRADAWRWDLPYGCDEFLLAALSLGAKGAVGSTFNFAAPVYHRLIAAFQRGDLAAARDEQFRSVQLIQLLASYGYMGAAKAVMGMLDVPVGPARLPNGNLSAEQATELRCKLDAMGFFEWVTP
jgi:N-acetylneuraminate lyase